MQDIVFKEPEMIPARDNKFFHLDYTIVSCFSDNNWRGGLYSKNGFYRDKYSLNEIFELSDIKLGFNKKLNTLYALPAVISPNTEVNDNIFSINDDISENTAINFNFLIKEDFYFSVNLYDKTKISGVFGLFFNYETTDVTKNYQYVPSIYYDAQNNQIVCTNHDEVVAVINSPSLTIEIAIARINGVLIYKVNGINVYSEDIDKGIVISIFMSNTTSGLSFNVLMSGKARIISPFSHIRYETTPVKSIYYYIEGGDMYPLSTVGPGVEDGDGNQWDSETGFAGEVSYIWSARALPAIGYLLIANKNGDSIYSFYGSKLKYSDATKIRYNDGILCISAISFVTIINFRDGYSLLIKPYVTGQSTSGVGVRVLRYPYFLDFDSVLGETSYDGDINNSALDSHKLTNVPFVIDNNSLVQSISVKYDKIDFCVRYSETGFLGQNMLCVYTLDKWGNTHCSARKETITSALNFNNVPFTNFVIRRDDSVCNVWTGNTIYPDRYNCLKSTYEDEIKNSLFRVEVENGGSPNTFVITPTDNVKLSTKMDNNLCFIMDDTGSRDTWAEGVIRGVLSNDDEPGSLVVVSQGNLLTYVNPIIWICSPMEEDTAVPANFLSTGARESGDIVLIGGLNGIYSDGAGKKILCIKPFEETITDQTVTKVIGSPTYNESMKEWTLGDGSGISEYIFLDKDSGFIIDGWISFNKNWGSSYKPFFTYTPLLNNGFAAFEVKVDSGLIYIRGTSGVSIELKPGTKYPFCITYDPGVRTATMSIIGQTISTGFMSITEFDDYPIAAVEAFHATFRNDMSMAGALLKLSSLRKTLTSTPVTGYSVKHPNFNSCGDIFNIMPLQDNSEIIIASENGLFRTNINQENSVAVKITDSVSFGEFAHIDLLSNGDFCICSGKTSPSVEMDLYKLPYSLVIESFEDNPVLIPPYETGFASKIGGLRISNGDGKISEIFNAIKRYMLVPGTNDKVATRAVVLKAHDSFSPIINPFVPYDIIKRTNIYSIKPIDKEVVNKIWESFKINMPAIINDALAQKIDAGDDLSDIEKISVVCAVIFWRYCHYVVTGE